MRAQKLSLKKNLVVKFRTITDLPETIFVYHKAKG
jgi:hypothetical protein